MKPGVRVINCARGGLIDEAALYAALKEGKVAGAALDVFETEPPPADFPLRELPNVICTPHLGASTEEAQANVAVAICEQIVEVLLYGTIMNAVNAPSVSQEALVQAEALPDPGRGPGRLSRPRSPRAPSLRCRIAYVGEVSKLDTKPLTHSLLKGMLFPVMRDEVNYVNAPAMAAARGIHISEEKMASAEDFSSLIRLTVRADNEENIGGRHHLRQIRAATGADQQVPPGGYPRGPHAVHLQHRPPGGHRRHRQHHRQAHGSISPA